MHIYISFARVDEPFGKEIARELQKHHTVAYDDRLFARDWWQTALMRLNSADVLLYLISSEGAAAEYCRRECEVMQAAGRGVIPVLVADGAPALFMLEGYTMIDVRSGITPERLRILMDVLRAVKPKERKSVYEVEAAKRPFEVAKDDAGTLITDANQAAMEQEWEKAVYLLRSALATGFSSQLVDVGDLLNDAEAQLKAQQFERQASRPYQELRRQSRDYTDYETFRNSVRRFAEQYPGYDPDSIVAQAGVEIRVPLSTLSEDVPSLTGIPAVSTARDYRKHILGVFIALAVVFWFASNSERFSFLLPPSSTPRPTFNPFATSTPRPFTAIPAPTVTNPAIDVDMRLIADGCFEMGSEDGDSDESPRHQVCVDAFWLDRYEVSNGQFDNSGGQAAGENDIFGGDTPRIEVTWNEARAYCALRGARLPTEAEWEYAASWHGRLAYPWGDVFTGSRANTLMSSDSYLALAPVTAFRNFATPDGIVNLSGNVAEWVSSAYRPYPYDAQDGRERVSPTERVVRGGSFLSTELDLRAASRDMRPQDSASVDVGFRCARDA